MDFRDESGRTYTASSSDLEWMCESMLYSPSELKETLWYGENGQCCDQEEMLVHSDLEAKFVRLSLQA